MVERQLKLFLYKRYLKPESRTESSLDNYLTRKLVVTPFDGWYGCAGWVVCVEGSPPKGTLVIMSNSDWIESVTYIRAGRSKTWHGYTVPEPVVDYWKHALERKAINV